MCGKPLFMAPRYTAKFFRQLYGPTVCHSDATLAFNTVVSSTKPAAVAGSQSA